MKIDNRHKLIGHKHRALTRDYMILNRVKNFHLEKNKHYKNMEVNLNKEQFIDWFMIRDFEGCTVDRIDNSNGYFLENLQVITKALNFSKDRLIARDGMTRCYRCGETKELHLFSKNNRNLSTGRSTCCKKCDVQRKKIKTI